MGLSWGAPVALEAGASPYAHWRREIGEAPPDAPLAEDAPQGLPAACRAAGPQPAEPAAELLPEGAAISAVIDDAIPFAHGRLRLDDRRSRVAFVWLMGAPTGGSLPVPFGRAFDRAGVDALLAAHAAADGVDEAAVYRAAGLLDPAGVAPQSAALRVSHGAAVADVAAGRDWRDPAAARNPVMAVCVPATVTEDVSGSFLTPYLIAALTWILRQRDRLAARARAARGEGADFPLAITVGYGLSAGGKDGLDAFDAALDAALSNHRGAPVTVLTPAGNQRLARVRGRLDGSRRDALAWRLPPDDATASFLEVWGTRRPRPAAPTLAVALTAPGGAAAGAPAFERFDSFSDLLDGAGVAVGRAYLQWRGGTEGRERLTLAMRPTAADSAGAPFAPPGDWAMSAAPGADAGSWPLDLHVQRDDAIPGYRRRGRQSTLVDPDYRWVDDAGRLAVDDPIPPGALRRAGSHNALGCAAGATQVGALYRSTGRPAPYSAAGFAPPARARPDSWVPVDRSPARPWRMAAGVLSGSRGLVSGTSFAAPQAARDLIDGWLGP